MLIKTETGIALNADPVEIGSRFTRSHAIVRDAGNGNYWERLPTFGESEERVQKALLKKPKLLPIRVAMEVIELTEFRP